MIENYSSAIKTRAIIEGCQSRNIFFILFFHLLFISNVDACNCGDIAPLSRAVVSQYELVLKGKVQRILPCENGSYQIEIKAGSIYYGAYEQEITLRADCSGTCAMVFNMDEHWLLYCTKNNAQKYLISPCGHSRKFPSAQEVDYEAEVRGTSVFEDAEYLESNFEIAKEVERNLEARKYRRVEPGLIPIFLGVSLLFMLAGYFVIKRVRK